MTQCLPSSVWICLSQPNDIRNIGGAIRAVANFGLAGLKVYRPSEELLPREELLLFSSGALEHIQFEQYHQLLTALEPADFIVGTSRRPRKNEQLIHANSNELNHLLSHKRQPHLLFGNERVGLLHHELDLCHALVEIHSDHNFPSLNLAHAVACLAYEITRPINPTPNFLNLNDQATQSNKSMATLVEEEAFLQRVIEVCERTAYPPGKKAETYARQLRNLVRRASPSAGDYGMILGLFRELDRLSHEQIE